MQEFKNKINPISYCIPEEHVVPVLNKNKTYDFAPVIPGDSETYIFKPMEEDRYFDSYRKSYFGLTWSKSGWDTLRHYEIMATGCLPYFIDIENCPANTLTFLPKELLIEIKKIKGVYVNSRPLLIKARGHKWYEHIVDDFYINHKDFDKDRYWEIASELLKFTRENLTTRVMANVILNTIKKQYDISNLKKILYMTNRPALVHYQSSLILHGLKKLLGSYNVYDVPRLDFLYKDNLQRDKLYGHGFTYANLLDNVNIDRTNIKKRIASKEFDLIIYCIGPLVGDSLKYWSFVKKYYEKKRIIVIDGMDFLDYKYSLKMEKKHSNGAVYFRREISENSPINLIK